MVVDGYGKLMDIVRVRRVLLQSLIPKATRQLNS